MSGFEPKGSRRKRCLLSRLCSKLVAFSLSLKFSLSHRKSHSLLRPLGALCSFPVGITTAKLPIYQVNREFYLFSSPPVCRKTKQICEQIVNVGIRTKNFKKHS